MYIIYTISNCKYCELAKDLLNGIQKIIINCDEMLKTPISRMNFINSINNKIGYPILNVNDKITFPIIFLKDDYIGGYTDLKSYLELDDTLSSYYLFSTNQDF